MNMLEDYLRAVSRLLPRAKREDIIAELRDEILTRIEAKESELGHTLTADETEQVLRDFGHPIVVAARYRDDPQYGVGPAFYPYWIFAVRFAVILEVFVSLIVFVTRTISGGNIAEAFGTAIGTGISGAMTLIGFATVVAWLAERKGININYLNNWRVRDLRFLDFAFSEWGDVKDWLDAVRTHQYQEAKMNSSYASAYDHRPYTWNWGRRQYTARRGVAAMVGGVIMCLWWMGLISFGESHLSIVFTALNLDPGALANVDYAALKTALYWPILGYFIALIGFGAAILAYPRGVRIRGLIDIALGLMIISLVGWIWTASSLAPIVSVGSLGELMEKVSLFVAHPVPVPLTTLATVFLALTAIGGFFRALGGLWEAVTGAPRYPTDDKYAEA